MNFVLLHLHSPYHHRPPPPILFVEPNDTLLGKASGHPATDQGFPNYRVQLEPILPVSSAWMSASGQLAAGSDNDSEKMYSGLSLLKHR